MYFINTDSCVPPQALVAEIEQNQVKLDECQTYSKHYCTAVKVSALSEWMDSTELLWTELVLAGLQEQVFHRNVSPCKQLRYIQIVFV